MKAELESQLKRDHSHCIHISHTGLILLQGRNFAWILVLNLEGIRGGYRFLTVNDDGEVAVCRSLDGTIFGLKNETSELKIIRCDLLHSVLTLSSKRHLTQKEW